MDEPSENSGGSGAPAADRFYELLCSARAGNQAAMGDLMSQCRDYLLLIAKFDHDRDLQAKFGVSDFVQHTMLAACEHLHQFRGRTPEEFNGWVRQILRNEINRARKQFGAQRRKVSREHRMDDSRIAQPSIMDLNRTPCSDAVLREQARALNEALSQLPENYRLAIQYREFEDLTFPEIGNRLNLSEEAARKLWRRAITRLETMLHPLLSPDSKDAESAESAPES